MTFSLKFCNVIYYIKMTFSLKFDMYKYTSPNDINEPFKESDIYWHLRRIARS